MEAVVAQEHKSVNVTRRLWVRSPLGEMNISFLRSDTHAEACRCVPTLNNASKTERKNGVS